MLRSTKAYKKVEHKCTNIKFDPWVCVRGRNFSCAISRLEGVSVPDFSPEGLTMWPPITLTNAQTHPNGHLYYIAGTLYTLRY